MMPLSGFTAALVALLTTVVAHSVLADPQVDYRRPASADAKGVAASIVLIALPQGEYLMGSTNTGFQGGHPPHRVHVAAFRMAKYDITFDQFDVFARSTGRPLAPDEGWGRGARPVINVDWPQIRAFIDWLNKGSGAHFRLPTEAEWEYAARGGTATTYWWGDEPNSDYANTAVDTGADRWRFTSPVGSFPTNPFGLADMLGNVWQVVQDCRHLTYDGAPTDGSAWLTGDCDSRVARGGYFGSMRIGIRSFTRAAVGEHFHSMGLGFRLAADTNVSGVH